ncbi:MAG TPA: SDR family oxidoreductase [Patescibacteria group bacterium]|nr:SDR family oxidoreductase [Patescibacteria group bacterium]
MNKLYGDVVLIAGASSGMGKAIAEALSQEGYRVYGTSRKVNTASDDEIAVCTDTGGFIKMIQLDVCSDESAEAAVGYVKEKEGRIDILVNCAGFALAGAVEDTTHEEAFKEFNTNFFGAHRMCRYTAPIMRQNGRGLIINISSTAGLISVPFQSFYSASKYALEAMTEALRMELKPYGIKVSMIEPGDTKTGFTNSRICAEASKDSVYKATFDKSIARMVKDEQSGPPPVGIVRAVKRIVNSSNPPVRQVVGPINKILVFLKWILPDRLVEFIVSKLYA